MAGADGERGVVIVIVLALLYETPPKQRICGNFLTHAIIESAPRTADPTSAP